VKILKRIILVLLVLLVLAQIPFVYRRYQTGKLAEKITQLDAQRTSYTDPHFKEYKGIIHAHTNLGGHSTGSFEELIAAANSNDLDFVLMTEHYSDAFDTASQTLTMVAICCSSDGVRSASWVTGACMAAPAPSVATVQMQ
jgi:hypothetical protein